MKLHTNGETENKPRILVADDEDSNRRLLEAMLVPLNYEVLLARDGIEALDIVSNVSPDLILLDVMMPRMNGFEVARRLKTDDGTRIIPIVMVTSLSAVEDRVQALEVGADDFLTKPVDKLELRARIHSLLRIKAYNDRVVNHKKELEVEVAKRTHQLRHALEKIELASLETIHRLSRAAEIKDIGTGGHIQRMSQYSAAIARRVGLDSGSVEDILYAAPMHDIGKIGIADQILLKPGKLSPAEWEIVKHHSILGAQILEGSDAEAIRLAEAIALTHHEKWDGSGYPRGLRGTDIPLVGRISAIADVFDALTSKRPYKEPFPLQKAFTIIREERGNHFAPQVVDAFFAAQNEILAIWEKYKD